MTVQTLRLHIIDEISFAKLTRFCLLSKKPLPPLLNRQCKAGWKLTKKKEKYMAALHCSIICSSLEGNSYKKLPTGYTGNISSSISFCLHQQIYRLTINF